MTILFSTSATPGLEPFFKSYFASSERILRHATDRRRPRYNYIAPNLKEVERKEDVKMMMKSALLALMGLAAITEASRIPRHERLVSRQNGRNRGGNNNNNAGNNNADAGGNNAASETCLNADAVQTGSASTGQQNGVAADGQVNSAT